MRLNPNERDVAFMSRGISRNLALDGALLDRINAFNGPDGPFYTDPNSFEAIPLAQGGGNLNGSQNTAHLIGQAGTACTAISLPRHMGAGDQFAGTPDAGTAPVISTAPFLMQEFDTLKSTDGNWSTASAAPAWKNYVWRRDGTVVAGGTATLAVTKADNGHSFNCTVIAVNGFGSGSSTSNSVVVAGAT
jgi:hypothetical protein